MQEFVRKVALLLSVEPEEKRDGPFTRYLVVIGLGIA